MGITAYLAAAFAAAAPAHAATSPFCHDLQLTIRSGHDRPSFASVTRVRPPPTLMQFRACRANIHDFTDEVTCILPLTSADPVVEVLAAEALQCLPGARRWDSSEARERGEAWLSFGVGIRIGQVRASSDSAGNQARITVSIPEG